MPKKSRPKTTGTRARPRGNTAAGRAKDLADKPPRAATAVARERFLAAFAQSCNVADAARAAGVDRSTHYVWLRDPDYRKRFLTARENAIDDLEIEAWRRAKAGSDRLLMFLLSSYRRRFRQDAAPEGPPASEMEQMQEAELLRMAEAEIQSLGYATLDECLS